MTVLLGTLCSSIKQIEDPYVFDWESAVALEIMQGNRASSRREGKASWVFSNCSRNMGYILELRRRCPFETGVCSVKSGHLARYEGYLRNVNQASPDNTEAYQDKWEFRSLFIVGRVLLGFLSIFMKSQASSHFEALNSKCLSKCQQM